MAGPPRRAREASTAGHRSRASLGRMAAGHLVERPPTGPAGAIARASSRGPRTSACRVRRKRGDGRRPPPGPQRCRRAAGGVGLRGGPGRRDEPGPASWWWQPGVAQPAGSSRSVLRSTSCSSATTSTSAQATGASEPRPSRRATRPTTATTTPGGRSGWASSRRSSTSTRRTVLPCRPASRGRPAREGGLRHPYSAVVDPAHRTTPARCAAARFPRRFRGRRRLGRAPAAQESLMTQPAPTGSRPGSLSFGTPRRASAAPDRAHRGGATRAGVGGRW